MRRSVLVVDDDSHIRQLVAHHLTREGYRVYSAASAEEATEILISEPVDLVVLDLILPGTSGYALLRRLREETRLRSPGVLVLTALGEEEQRIQGLAAGADDYLVKPFSPRELVLRVQNILRRLESAPVQEGSVIRAGPLRIDTAAGRVTLHSEELRLTPMEHRLLLALVSQGGKALSRQQLLATVWHAAAGAGSRTVDVHIRRLREKLGNLARCLETVRGFGYRFRLPDEDRGPAS
jgi:two-component system phosphate regulon response regulator PhoB